MDRMPPTDTIQKVPSKRRLAAGGRNPFKQRRERFLAFQICTYNFSNFDLLRPMRSNGGGNFTPLAPIALRRNYMRIVRTALRLTMAFHQR
jgi:hypothetical protein